MCNVKNQNPDRDRVVLYYSLMKVNRNLKDMVCILKSWFEVN